MTENAAFKRAARKLAKDLGVSYAEARRLLLEAQRGKAHEEKRESK